MMKPETIESILLEANKRVPQWSMSWNGKEKRFELRKMVQWALMLDHQTGKIELRQLT